MVNKSCVASPDSLPEGGLTIHVQFALNPKTAAKILKKELLARSIEEAHHPLVMERAYSYVRVSGKSHTPLLKQSQLILETD